jgi:hypothetical protein
MEAIIAVSPGLRPAQQTTRSDSSRKKPCIKNRSAPIRPIPIRSLRTKWSQRRNKPILFGGTKLGALRTTGAESFRRKFKAFAKLICPSGRLSEFASIPLTKNNSLFQKPKSGVCPRYPVPTRRAYRDRHDTWCGMRWTRAVLPDEQS